MSDSKQATRLRRRDHWASLKRGRRYRATLDNNLKDKLSRRIKEKNHMSWKMDVRKDEPVPPGWYEAECRNVEDVDSAFGMRLRWMYWLPKVSAEVSGWTSMSPSTKARAYQWAEVLNGGPIDPKSGWGPETVEGKRCWVKVEAYKDSKGETRTKVTEIKPIEEKPEEEVDFSDIST